MWGDLPNHRQHNPVLNINDLKVVIISPQFIVPKVVQFTCWWMQFLARLIIKYYISLNSPTLEFFLHWSTG